MKAKTIKLNYPSPARFFKDFKHIKKGTIFLPSKNFYPIGTEISINIVLAGIRPVFSANIVVKKILKNHKFKDGKTRSGMVATFIGGSKHMLMVLEPEMMKVPEYKKLLDLYKKGTAEKGGVTVIPSIDEETVNKRKFNPEDTVAAFEVEPEKEEPEHKEQPKPAEVPDKEVKKVQDKEPEKSVAQKEKEPDHKEQPKLAETPDKEIKKTQDKKPETIDAQKDKEPESKKIIQKGELSPEWIKKAVALEAHASGDEEIEEEDLPPPPPPPPVEKKQLTPEEFERVKPVGEFVMNLTRAMLRSGYYEKDHPGTEKAKRGLFDELNSSLGDSSEIMLSLNEESGQSGIMIFSILEDPVSVRLVVGAGQSEIFEPRLQEYFKRKNLLSFTVKKNITLEHFEKFVDIMCAPDAEDGEEAMEVEEEGEALTSALVNNGITEITTVFLEETITILEDIPWRVQMAIQRLAKDLKTLPAFEDKSEADLRAMKVEIIKDIIRPLQHPEFLKDMLLNCHVIAQNVKRLDLEELEQTLVDAFPEDKLLQTSQIISDDLKKWVEAKKKNPKNREIVERFDSISRVLKMISFRMVAEKTPGIRLFLEQMYFNGVVTYEELPDDVKIQADTTKMVKDLVQYPDYYTEIIRTTKSEEDGLVSLKWFHRVGPKLVEHEEWQLILDLITASEKVAKETDFFSGTGMEGVNPFVFFLYEYADELAISFSEADKDGRNVLNEIIDYLGPFGVNVLGKVLAESEDRNARKAALDSFEEKGKAALKWVRKTLDDKNQSWYLHRNSLQLLDKLGKGDDDAARAIKFLSHKHARVREEALKTLYGLNSEAAEKYMTEAIDDEDENVSLRALHTLSSLKSFSEKTMIKLIDKIKSEAPKEKDEAARHAQKISQLVRIMTSISDPPVPDKIEEALLELIETTAKKHKWFSKFYKAHAQKNQLLIITSAIRGVRQVGSSEAQSFFEEIAKKRSAYAKLIKEALAKVGI